MLAMGGAAVAAVVMVAYAFFRPAENPEEIEKLSASAACT